MASATLIPFPGGRGTVPEPVGVGNVFLSKASELVLARAGKSIAAVRVDDLGNVTLVDPECDFFDDAISAPGFACLLSEGSDPVRIAARLRAAHLDFLAWGDQLSEGGEA